MLGLYFSGLGLAAFLVGAAVLGWLLRKHPTKENAEKYSRVMHFLFFVGLNFPFFVLLFLSPGLRHLDSLVGLSPLSPRWLFLVLGVILLLPGMYLLSISNKLIRSLGSGANAFRLTTQVAQDKLYKLTRNPMSLGFYLFALSLGLLTGSKFLTLAALLGVIPAHLFFLLYFEEKELELRFGDSYLEYKKRTPFLFPRLSSRS